ncbi:nucleoside hydrolase [Nonomuraea sp. NPDC048882]|uniref:nucleoside hydrolase n=1 Tax=Nonomuraea sp. NPDC048882 TaxID=3154347 RepID=UPI0033D2AE14
MNRVLMSTTSRRPVYLDCDTGIDDSLALAYLLASPEIELVGVGTVCGNTSATQAARNTLDLLALAGRHDIPVAVGAADWLTRAFDGGVPQIHGPHGVGGIQLPPSETVPVDEAAAELLIRLSHEYAGQLQVVTVGPLTNIALALTADPTLADRVASVTTMGGAALVPGNVTAVAEANIWNDPEAAQHVIAAHWDITLVPLDVTLENTLAEKDRQQLLQSADPLARSLGEILDFYFDFYLSFYRQRGCALHDPLAAAIAVGGVQATTAPAIPAQIDTTHGPSRGQTVLDLREQRHGPVDHPGCRTRVVLATDQPLGPHLIQRLTTPVATLA